MSNQMRQFSEMRYGVVRETISKFPSASHRTIAQVLMKEHSALFPSYDAARQLVRRQRGAASGYAEKHPGAPRALHPSKWKSGDNQWTMPDGVVKCEGWGPHVVTSPNPYRALIMNDLHIPFHSPREVETALCAGRDRKVDKIILNGDIADCHACSRWEVDPRKRKFAQEVDAVRQFLGYVRQMFPDAEIIYKLGNHEERYEKYMWLKCAEFLSVDKFEFRSVFDLDVHNIKLVGEKRPIRLGDLNLIHGHEYRFAISNPVSPARGLFLRAKAYAMCGHFHQPSYHPGKTIEDKIVACWSIGCLCDMHPDYAPFNEWSHGFAIVTVEPDGKFYVDNKIIRHGRIY